MEIVTTGLVHYTGFSLPITVSESSLVPPKGYYGVLCLEEGSIALHEEKTIRYLHAPATIICGDNHELTRIVSSESARIQSLVFRIGAINSTLPGESGLIYSHDGASLVFLRPFLNIPLPGYECRTLSPSSHLTVSLLFRRLQKELLGEQGPFWPCMSRSYLLELLLLLERERYTSGKAETLAIAGNEPLNEILEYLHTHYADKISLDSLAAHFATNRTSLNKRFRHTLGVSAIAYLTQVRIEVASAMLRNTLLSIQEIALRTGFTDESYFSRVFRQKMGESPLAFRSKFPDPYGPVTDIA